MGSEDDRAGERDALPLAAGELVDAALAEAFELHERQRGRDPRPDVAARNAARLERKGDVVGDAHMREQRVVLEHDADAAPMRRGSVTSSSPRRARPCPAGRTRR